MTTHSESIRTENSKRYERFFRRIVSKALKIMSVTPETESAQPKPHTTIFLPSDGHDVIAPEKDPTDEEWLEALSPYAELPEE